MFVRLLLLVVAISSFLEVQSASLDAKSARQKYNVLFSTDGDAIAPEETFKLLLELKRSFAMELKDSADPVVVERLAGLIGASLLLPDKCSKLQLLRLDQLIEDNSAYEATIEPYLLECKRKQLDLCRRSFESRFGQSLTKLGDELQADLLLFQDEVTKNHNNIAKATFAFLSAKNGLIKGVSEEKFLDMFRNQLTRICSQTFEHLGDFWYLASLDGEKAFAERNEQTEKLLKGVGSCKLYLDNIVTVFDESFECSLKRSRFACFNMFRK